MKRQSIQSKALNAEIETANALVQPLTCVQERNVLNHLPEAIAVVSDNKTAENHPQNWQIQFANKAFSKLFATGQNKLEQSLLKDHVPLSPNFMLYEAMAVAISQRSQQNVTISARVGDETLKLRVSITPHDTATGEKGSINSDFTKVLLCLTDVTELANRADYLEERAVKLIDHAQGLANSRSDLEKEAIRLQREIKTLQRITLFDRVSGLAKRSHFLESGAAEFQRSQRYGHVFSVVVFTVQGYFPVKQDHGSQIANNAITAISEMCRTTWRDGTDFGGRTAENEISILLPETHLTHAIQFIERLQKRITSTPVQLEQKLVRFGILASVDTVHSEDVAFIEVLNRAKQSQPPLPPFGLGGKTA